jgi:hypothetical protein
MRKNFIAGPIGIALLAGLSAGAVAQEPMLRDAGENVSVRGAAPAAPLDKGPFIDEVDANHDGCLSHEEWTAAGAPESSYQGLKDANGCARFTSNPPPAGLDTNGDGKLTLAEMKAFDLRMRQQGPAARAAE